MKNIKNSHSGISCLRASIWWCRCGISLFMVCMLFALSACHAKTPEQSAQGLGLSETTHLKGVHFVDLQHGWAVGRNGAMIATVDGGHHWNTQESGIKEDLNSVHFTDAQHGWAAGNEGVIIVTRDGGHHWSREEKLTNSDLLSIYFHDAQHGWAAGREATIMATTDGGKHWQKQVCDESAGLGAIHFLNAQQGWMVGGHGVWATSNGGKQWQLLPKDKNQGIDNVYFIDSQHGWATGDMGGGYSAVMATNDGGVHWQTQDSIYRHLLMDMDFRDAQHGWVVGGEGLVLATADGGKQWQQQASNTDQFLAGVSFVDVQHGWAVGDAATVIATSDGGKTWDRQLSISPAKVAEIAEQKPQLPPQGKPAPGTRLYLAIVGYNYTNHAIDQFTVNGLNGGSLQVSSETSGGGGESCCVPYISGANVVQEEVRWVDDGCVFEKQISAAEKIDVLHSVFKTVAAKVTLPIPAKPAYLEVHIYPDKHVELAMTERLSPPRLSLHKSREIKPQYPRCPNGSEPTE